ncbi:MAG: Lrp/AsnC family transcriptional regulator [Candidatus Bathyarchaeia archaeon]|jgi:DNA-binding Lrp family transcriptional regulator
MSIDIDSIDVKILYALIKNARTKVKNIAKECNISPTAITKRIERLKKAGVITGAVLLIDMSKVGALYPGSIEIENIKEEQSQKVEELLIERTNILVKSFSTGKSDLGFFFVTKNKIDIESLRAVLKKYSESGKIRIAFWNTPCCLNENIIIETSKRA